MNKRHYKKPLVRDKVDMSLDDIIRLNKKEQHTKGKQPNKNQQTLCRRRTPRTQGKTKIRSRNINGGVFQVGGGGAATKLRPRAIPGVRRIQGVVTGLAARRNATLLRRPAQERLGLLLCTEPLPSPRRTPVERQSTDHFNSNNDISLVCIRRLHARPHFFITEDSRCKLWYRSQILTIVLLELARGARLQVAPEF